MKRAFLFPIAVIPLALLLAFASLHAGPSQAPLAGPDEAKAYSSSGKPNVIVIMTDDQSKKAFGPKIMPLTFKAIGPQAGGTLFTQGFAVPPLCCPSRAGFITGQYPHNHGVWQNNYALLEDKENVISTWLKLAGYRTALVGKYLNKYELAVTGDKEISPRIPLPPGYDYVYQTLTNGYRNYYVSVGGQRKRHGSAGTDYVTNVLNRKAVSFIKDHASGEHKDSPFFLYLAHFAPHPGKSDHPSCRGRGSADVMRQDWREWGKKPVVLGANFNESDISDKPAPERGNPKLTAAEVERAKTRLRCARAAMAPVDRGVRDIVQTLRHHKILDDTVIFFVSDNGFFYGEHRILMGKNRPYREAMEVPFLAWVPSKWIGQDAPGRVDQPVGTIDLAPTILDLAGLGGWRPRAFDGMSLRPALEGRKLDREWLLFEQRKPCRKYSSVLDIATNTLYSVWFDRNPVAGKCQTVGRELYHLNSDPDQLHNQLTKLKGDPAVTNRKARQKAKRQLQQALRQCNRKRTAKARKRCRQAARRKIQRARKRAPASVSDLIRAEVQRLEGLRLKLSSCSGEECRRPVKG